MNGPPGERAPSMPEDLRELLRSLVAGPGTPAPELDRLRQRIWEMAQRRLGPADRLRRALDSEDLAQEALAALIDAAPGFRGRSWGEFIAFAGAVLDRTIQGQARRNGAECRDPGRVDPAPPSELTPGRGPTPSAELASEEDRRRAHALLESLPAAFREPLRLRLHDRSYEEIAAASGISAEAARQRVSRALRMLRELW